MNITATVLLYASLFGCLTAYATEHSNHDARSTSPVVTTHCEIIAPSVVDFGNLSLAGTKAAGPGTTAKHFDIGVRCEESMSAGKIHIIFTGTANQNNPMLFNSHRHGVGVAILNRSSGQSIIPNKLTAVDNRLVANTITNIPFSATLRLTENSAESGPVTANIGFKLSYE